MCVCCNTRLSSPGTCYAYGTHSKSSSMFAVSGDAAPGINYAFGIRVKPFGNRLLRFIRLVSISKNDGGEEKSLFVSKSAARVSLTDRSFVPLKIEPF